MSTWHVYLLHCADGTLYCGITTDPQRRLDQHNGLRPGGARYTRARRPVELYAVVPCPDRSSAGRLEKFVQSQPRHGKLDALRAGIPDAPRPRNRPSRAQARATTPKEHGAAPEAHRAATPHPHAPRTLGATQELP